MYSTVCITTIRRSDLGSNISSNDISCSCSICRIPVAVTVDVLAVIVTAVDAVLTVVAIVVVIIVVVVLVAV